MLTTCKSLVTKSILAHLRTHYRYGIRRDGVFYLGDGGPSSHVQECFPCIAPATFLDARETILLHIEATAHSQLPLSRLGERFARALQGFSVR